jgi:hypothetical protein
VPRAAWWVLGCLLACRVASAETRVDAELDVARQQIVGTVTFDVVNPSAGPLDRAYVWLHANRFSRRPRALDDINFPWVYPERFEPGETVLGAVQVGGRAARFRETAHAVAGEGTLVEVALLPPVPPGATVALAMGFRTRIPTRFGAFGCFRGTCTLVGLGMPLLASLDAAGWDLEAPPQRGAIHGEVRLPAGWEAHGGTKGRIEVRETAARWPTAVVARRFWVQQRMHRGVELVYVGREAPPPANDAAEQVLPYVSEDRGAQVLDVAARAIDVLSGVAEIPAGKRFVFVSAPLRLDLAIAEESGTILVSDRAFAIFPLRRFRKFHEREIARVLYTAWLDDGGGGLPDEERDLGAEVGAAFLTELFTVAAYRKTEFAGEVLAPVSFVPMVDQLLTDRLIAFADAYFGGPADSDPFRDDLRRFSSTRPRGHFLFEKLRDRLSGEQLVAAMKRLVGGGGSVGEAVGPEAAGLIAVWRRAAPPFDVRLGRIIGRRVGVVRDLLPGNPLPPVEPVEVRVIDAEGRRFDLVWDGEGASGEVEAVGAALPLRSVLLDPRGRLVQARIDPGRDPRGDDRTPVKHKLLYNGFGINFAAADRSLGLLADFTLKRQNDPSRTWRLQLVSDEAVLFLASLGWTRSFGDPVTPGRLPYGVGFTTTASRLRSGFAGAESGANRLSLVLRTYLDTRRSILQARGGWTLSGGVRGTVTLFDDEDDALLTGSVFASATRTFAPADGHVVVVDVDAAVVGGDVVSRAQLLGAGGIGGLRGYSSGELFARGRVLGRVEWRGLLVGDLHWNLGHFAWVRSASAAAFVDVGALSGCETVGSGGGMWASAGVGLRVLYENFGVQPTVLAVDVAVPLRLERRECLGGQTVQLAERPPVSVYVSFVPGL